MLEAIKHMQQMDMHRGFMSRDRIKISLQSLLHIIKKEMPKGGQIKVASMKGFPLILNICVHGMSDHGDLVYDAANRQIIFMSNKWKTLFNGVIDNVLSTTE